VAPLLRISRDIDLTVGYSVGRYYRIHEYDASGAEARIDQTCVLERGGWSTRIECVTMLSADAECFRLQATLVAHEGDELFLSGSGMSPFRVG